MTPIPDVLGSKILSFLTLTSHAQVSKGFAALTKRAMEQEWRALGSHPLLAKQVAAIVDPPPLCFKKLFNEQGEAFLTSTCYDKFVAVQPAFAGSYSRARFEKGAALLVEDAEEQDRNLERAWRPADGWAGIANAVELDPNAPDFPKTATEIRAYLDNPANLAAINQVTQIEVHEGGLTGIPPEIARFTMIRDLALNRNQIRYVPKELYNLKHLDQLNLDVNRFEYIPKMLLENLHSERGIIDFIDLRSNPIGVFPEDVYDYYFLYENWLGKPFSDTPSFFRWFGYGYLFGYVAKPLNMFMNVIGLSQLDLKEIPFALWLREKLYVINPVSLLIPDEHLSFLPEFLQAAAGLTCIIIAILTAPFLWLLNEFLSLVVVPIVTKVRELLGFGRMMRLD